ncbi:MAG: glycosyltransferase [Nitrospirae bacterium]|nr:glycosyltransferase [Nitrospirota bacterium]
MGRKPIVSVLTLVFNHGPYIKETIDSVLKQTYQNWEWIIIDDGSTDGTGDVIKNIKDSRIRYLCQENTGFDSQVKNYNKALSMSSGDLVAMLDGDDYWPEYKLEVQVKSFDDHGIILSYGECCLINQGGKSIGYMDLSDNASIACNTPIGSSLKAFLKIVKLKRYLFMHNSTVMLKRSALLNIGGFIYAPMAHGDFPTWTRLSLEGRFSAIPACLGYWRRHPSAATFGRNPLHLFDAGISFLKGFILENEKKLKEIGFSYDIDDLEKRWQETRKEFVTYHPYNTALQMMKPGLFEKSKSEFLSFLEKDRSLKSGMIYSLIALSSLLNFDILHPVIDLKERLRKIPMLYK